MRSKKRVCFSLEGRSAELPGYDASFSCKVAYSLAVSGLPSKGDRADVIISVRRISSGTSLGGGRARVVAGNPIAASKLRYHQN